ncbi:MAG TPA: hypothetical protein VLH61_12100 [Bacteroidales bacterium]|nr:hypothetical protein [Bacteroidales bacterium]
MRTDQIIERFGGVTKEEPLTTLPKDMVLSNTQVLESVNPFFGYYNDGPQVKKKLYVYLVLESHHPYELVVRATEQVKKRFRHSFDAVPGCATRGNITCQVIRVKDIKNFGQVIQLQELYQAEGIKFKKNVAPLKKEMTLIRLLKFFLLEPNEGGLYMDHLQKNVGYFRIPEFIDWEDFKKLTTQVKFETSLLFFDAATAFFSENCQLVSLVRIYKENITPTQVIPIKDRYLRLLG